MNAPATSEREPVRFPIGEIRGVRFDVLVRDAAGAPVDLSVACLFQREAEGAAMGGGLLHLDIAMGGLLRTLRTEGSFPARAMETLLITSPPDGIAASALLLLGLGDPATFEVERMEHAARVAAHQAIRLGAHSGAIAPGLLDSGMLTKPISGTGEAMLRGVLGALAAERRLAQLGLARSPALSRWSFGAGPAHAEAAAADYRLAFARLTR